MTTKSYGIEANPPYTLPDLPEPTEIEIEVTNHCNASCIACPRQSLSAPKGFMSEAIFHRIIETYSNRKTHYQINRLIGNNTYPIMSVAGLGEPLLHPQLAPLMSLAVNAEFRVTLFTNGNLLTEQKAEELIQSGIERIYVSFWGIEPVEYTRSMGLDYDRSLANVLSCAKLCHGTPTNLIICWIQTPLIQSAPQEILTFWRDKEVEVDMSEFAPWNRGGFLTGDMYTDIFARYRPFEFSKRIWCSQLYFADTITWDGQVVLCSQDYFQRTCILGDIDTPLPIIAQAKQQVLRSCSIPPMCQACRKPNRNYTYATEPWDEILSDEQRDDYTYDGVGL